MRRKIRIALFSLLLAELIGGLMLLLLAPFELKSLGILLLIVGIVVFSILVTALSRSYEQDPGTFQPQKTEYPQGH